jgi:predicted ester cyclase
MSKQAKKIVQRLLEDVINNGRLEMLDELYAAEAVAAARRWFEPFRRSFPDVTMELVTLVAEGDVVVGRFRCAGTHLGTWRGHPPTGRRFEGVDEVYFFTVRDGRIVGAWGLEDNEKRVSQLGLSLSA